MQGPRVEMSQVIHATPDVIWRVLTDYRVAHPQILPKPYFASLEVEQGGQGAGTVFRVMMEVMGSKQTQRMTVSEPEPGRVLVEEDPEAGVRTSFTVNRVEGGSLVTIATEWRAKPGLVGLGERLLNPPITRRIYKKQLALLEQRVGA